MSDPAFVAPAVWYDGTNALRHEGEARWAPPHGLELIEAGHPPLLIPAADLRFAEAMVDRRVFTRVSLPDFRLRLPRELPPGLAHHLPASQTYGGWIDRIGLGRAVIAFALASAAVVALFVTAPQWLGPMVPFSWERRIGDAMIGDLGNRLCSTPASDAALAKLMGEVAPGDRRVRAGIANLDMVNAVALPGGRVLLFNGLIEQAQSPDELAGVLAHEAGHVQKRHVMTAILRQFGLSVLLSGANSGVGETAFGLAALGYTREAEREADAAGRAALRRARISPLGAAGFFERMAEAKGDTGQGAAATGWLDTHPAPLARARTYRGDVIPGAHYTAALTPAEFKALKDACRLDKDVEDFDLF